MTLLDTKCEIWTYKEIDFTILAKLFYKENNSFLIFYHIECDHNEFYHVYPLPKETKGAITSSKDTLFIFAHHFIESIYGSYLFIN